MSRRLVVLAVALALGAVAAGGSTYLPTGTHGNPLAKPGGIVPGYGGPVSEQASGALETANPSANEAVNELEAGSVPHSTAPKRVEGSFIVALAPGQNPHDVAMGIARDYGGESGAVYDEVINGFQFLGPDDAGKRMAADPRIRSVQPDYEASVAETTAVTHLHADDAPCVPAAANVCGTAWYTLPYTGAGQRVAILDTGADLTHPDIAASIDQSTSTDASGGVCNVKNGSPQDLNGHGTRTTSNAVGAIGVAPDAKAVIVKVFPGSGTSTTFANIACGVNYVVGLNKNLDASKHVVAANASIAGSGGAGSCGDGGLRQAVCQLVDGTDMFSGNTPVGAPKWARAAFFAAAGNSGANAGGTAPARYPETIAVSAFDCDAVNCVGGTPKLASFSNRGPTIALGAPGVNILSAKLHGGRETASGTSRSSPQSVGAAADLVSAGVPVDQIRSVLQTGGRCPTSTVTKNSAGNCSTGTWPSDNDGIAEPFLDVAASINAFTPPAPTAPGAPANVTAVAGHTTATVSWAAAAPNGSPISSYKVTSSPGGLTTTVGGSTLSATVGSLTNGQAYTFTVMATNGIGPGPASSPSNSVTPTAPGPPSAPTSVTATAGNAQAAVSWTAPTTTGGSGITNYTVTSSPGGLQAMVNGSPPATAATVAGLTNGTSYTFTVTATNAGSFTSSPSAPSNTVTPTASTIFYSMAFDSSPASGWGVSSSNSTVKWHLANLSCGTAGTTNMEYPSGYGVYYGRLDSSCNYRTGSANSGALFSPIVQNITPTSYKLTFVANRNVDACTGCTRDQTFVDVNFQDGVWRRVYYADAGHAPSSPNSVCSVPAGPGFQSITCNLGNANHKIQVRYSFATTTSIDPSAHFGWAIDDFSIHS